jgi:hypothetical protein
MFHCVSQNYKIIVLDKRDQVGHLQVGLTFQSVAVIDTKVVEDVFLVPCRTCSKPLTEAQCIPTMSSY